MKKIFFTLLISFAFAYANTALISVAGGYKKPVAAVIKAFEADEKGEKIIYSSGNLSQVSAQVKSNKEIVLAIGEKKFLKHKMKLKFDNYIVFGQGKVVIIYKKGLKMNSYKDIVNMQKIAMPNFKGAIYGIRGKEFLEKTGLYEKLKPRLLVLTHVPQVASYVASGEVDAGIVNITAALAHKKNIGGFVEVPMEFYSPITIGAGELAGCKSNSTCVKFIKYLQSDKAKAIFKSYGL